MNGERKFFDLTAELVEEHKREKGLYHKDIADLLGVSESLIKQIHSYSNTKKYSIKQLAILAHHWKLNIEDFIPTKETLRKLATYQNYTERDLEQFCKKLYSDLASEVMKKGEE